MHHAAISSSTARIALGRARLVVDRQPPLARARAARRAARRRSVTIRNSSAPIVSRPSSAPSRTPASPTTSPTAPASRATTGTPEWNASSSGMQNPSCSDRHRNASARHGSASRAGAGDPGLEGAPRPARASRRASASCCAELRSASGLPTSTSWRVLAHSPVARERADHEVLALVRSQPADEQDRAVLPTVRGAVDLGRGQSGRTAPGSRRPGGRQPRAALRR